MVRVLGGIPYTLDPSEIIYGVRKERERTVSINALFDPDTGQVTLELVIKIENPEFTAIEEKKHKVRKYLFEKSNLKCIINEFKNNNSILEKLANGIKSINTFINYEKEIHHIEYEVTKDYTETYAEIYNSLTDEEKLILELDII